MSGIAATGFRHSLHTSPGAAGREARLREQAENVHFTRKPGTPDYYQQHRRDDGAFPLKDCK
jgi:hypothetical protein